MVMFKILYYVTLLCVILIVPILILCGINSVYVSMDAINTRSLECQSVVVENTSSINDGYGITFFIDVNNTQRMVLDTANENNIKRWGKIEPGDMIHMKLGKQTAVFC